MRDKGCTVRNPRGRFLFGALFGAIFALGPLHAAAQDYQIIELGTLGGDASGAQGVDEFGWAVGWSYTGSGELHGFLYGDGNMLDLGLLIGGTYSLATTISGEGRIAGLSGINQYGPLLQESTQGFVWEDGLMKPVGALHCACGFNARYGISEAHGVNNLGQVVGSSETARGGWVQHAFLREGETLVDIGGGAGDWSISRAFDINDKGQVVGDFAQDAGKLGAGAVFDRRAFLWQDGAREDLGTLPGHSSSSARGINANGHVTGWSGSLDGANAVAFLWKEGRMEALGTLPGEPASHGLALNDHGDVVGWSGSADQSFSRAFLWQAGEMRDLNDLLPAGSEWVLVEASDINNRGQIVGTGIKEGQLRAFLLQPSDLIEPEGGGAAATQTAYAAP